MFVQLFILLLGLMLLFAIWFWFYKTNKTEKRQHLERLGSLEKAIFLHRSQIGFRQKNLSCYEFLRYNLDEVLVVQAKIMV